MRIISIAKDFSATPGGRFNRDGPFSGEAFRQRFLEPAIASDEPVTINLDAVAGLPSSFLEEAFGGLVRAHRAIGAKGVLNRFKFETSEPDLTPYIGLIEKYVREAAAA